MQIPIIAARQFCDAVKNIQPLGNGLINDTYLVSTAAEPFVLQRINHQVFPHPEQVMANLAVLNQHVEQVNDRQVILTIPQLLKTHAGNNYYRDSQGDYWRALGFIANTESLEALSNLAQAEEVGFALGQFHRLTYNLDTVKLYDTLSGFHVTPAYLAHYDKLRLGIKSDEDPYCRDFITHFRHIANDLEEAAQKGLIAVRAIHGDPKLNNFLFDITKKRIVSIVDLDTVKPGLIFYDIGDCLRSCCHVPETNEFSLEICRALLASYLKEMGYLFSEQDYRFLYPAIRLIPFELGIRFYTDYLEGNRYFKVTQPKQNLHRAIEQFHLCASVVAQEVEINKLINYLCRQLLKFGEAKLSLDK